MINMIKKITFIFLPLILIISLIVFNLMRDPYRTKINHNLTTTINNNQKLKKLSNKKTFVYLSNHRNDKLSKETDNQGSHNIVYYSGYWGPKTIGITGKISHNNIKITRIFLNN